MYHGLQKSTTTLIKDSTFTYYMLHESPTLKVAGVFFREPTQEHYLKEISKKAKLAHTSVKTHLKKLENEAIIKKLIQKKGSRNFPVYKANINGGTYKKSKRHHNLHSPSFYGLLNYLGNKLMPKAIVLFGSYSRGEDTEESDIDIFVECSKEEIDLKQYEKDLNRKIQLHFNKNFKALPNELKNNIINGVVLWGYLEAF